MPLKKLWRVVIQNIRRSKRNFVFSSIGIIVGITTFTFFIALSLGIRDRVLNRIFPIDQLEVEPVGGVAQSKADGTADTSQGGLGDVLRGRPRALDQAAIDQLGKLDGVAMAFPKMRARFPAKVETGVLDRRMAGEGFMEGLDPSAQVLTEMRGMEDKCGALEEDTCKRREVSCNRDADCPHEGMECIEGQCKPRQYWKSFQDKHAPVGCTAASDCGAGKVCAYDKWVILKIKDRPDAMRLLEAARQVKHARLDVDLFVAVAEVGAVTDTDLRNVERVDGEVWAVATTFTDKAQALQKAGLRGGLVREFQTADEVLAHLQKLPETLTTGTCAGEPCQVERTDESIGSWKYFEMYENHRGDCAPGGFCLTRNVLSKQGRCAPYMPVALNPLMIDFYNSNVVSQLGTQPIPNACLVLGLKGYWRLGYSFLKDSLDPVWQRVYWAEIVGFSDKAMHLGGTVPLGYVERWNRFYLGPEATTNYDSVLLQVPRNEDVATVIEQIQKRSFDLSNSSKFARKAGEMLMVVTLTFLLISFIIIIISALNISHTFLMLVFERQREIGIMRAIGATRWDIRKIMLGESALIGLFAGLAGNGLSFGLSRLVNGLASGLRERFPVIPEDFFVYGWPLVGGSIAFALVFCLFGAWVPANRASKLDPAVVLTQA